MVSHSSYTESVQGGTGAVLQCSSQAIATQPALLLSSWEDQQYNATQLVQAMSTEEGTSSSVKNTTESKERGCMHMQSKEKCMHMYNHQQWTKKTKYHSPSLLIMHRFKDL